MDKVTAVIVARMGSSRLPGKALKSIQENPMLMHLVRRVSQSKYINRIVIATTDKIEDDKIEELANRLNVKCYRGLVNDVLGRVYRAASLFDSDIVLQILGDNPLIHSDLIDAMINYYKTNDFDCAVNVTTEQPYADSSLKKFPIGIRVEVLSPWTLKQCNQLADNPYYREHATSFIYNHPEIFRIGYFEALGRWATLNQPKLKLAVNNQEEFDFIEQIFNYFYEINPNFSLKDVMNFINK